jgi:hypothetical protein
MQEDRKLDASKDLLKSGFGDEKTSGGGDFNRFPLTSIAECPSKLLGRP